MKKIFLFCDTIIIDFILGTTKKLFNQDCQVFLQCEKLETKKIIVEFLNKEKMNDKVKVYCLNEYLTENFNKFTFEKKDFLDFENRYQTNLSELNISVSEFNIYHNYFDYYKDKIDLNYHSKARLLLIEKFYKKNFDNLDLDCVFVECPNHFNTISGVLYFQKRKISCYTYVASMYPEFFTINRVKDNLNPFLEHYYNLNDSNFDTQKNLNLDLTNFEVNRDKNDREKDYLDDRKKSLNKNIIKLILEYFKKFQSFNRKLLLENFYLSKTHPIDLIKLRFKKIINKKYYFKLINQRISKEIHDSKTCVFFLGLSPESSTYAQCNIFFDQSKVIRFIAMKLPSDYQLIVKEHPSQYISSDGRDLNFYKTILSHNNVKLAKTSDKAIDLINKSEFVITSTGTVGFESIILKKPLIMLGENYYKIYKNVFKSPDFNSLEKNIITLTQKTFVNEQENDEITKFFNSYKRSLFPGNLNIFFKKHYLTKREYEIRINQTSESIVKIINKLTEQ